MGESRGAISSSSNSLREIIPEGAPVSVVDLSNSEFVEGSVVQGVKFRSDI